MNGEKKARAIAAAAASMLTIDEEMVKQKHLNRGEGK